MSCIINAMYWYGRFIERISFRLGAGKFGNTDDGICRECILAGRTDAELCEGCRIDWLLHIDYSNKFQIQIATTVGLLNILVGIAGFWVNHITQWMDESPPMARIANAILSYIAESLAIASWLHIDLIIITIWGISLGLNFIALGLAIHLPSPKKKAYRALIFVFGCVSFLFLDFSIAEIMWIIFPQIVGSITLATAAKWRSLASLEPQEGVGLAEKHPMGAKM